MIIESLKNYYKKILFEVSLYDAEGVPVNPDTGNYNPFASPIYTHPSWWQRQQVLTTPTQSIIPQRNPFSGGPQWWDELAIQLGYGQGNLPQWLRDALERMGTSARDPQFLISFINFLRSIGFTGSNQQLLEIWGMASGALNNPNALQNQLFSFGNTRYMYFMGRWYTQTGNEGWVQRSSNFILQNVPQNLLNSLNLTAEQLNNMPFWPHGMVSPPWIYGIPFNHFTPEQWNIMFDRDPILAGQFSTYLSDNFEQVLRDATNPQGWLHQFFPDGLPMLPGGGIDIERIMQVIQSNPTLYQQFLEDLLQKMSVMFAGNNPNVESIAANMARTFRYILNNPRVQQAMQNNPILRRIIKNFLKFFDQTAKPIRQIIDAISMTDYGQEYDPDEVMIASMGGGYGGGGGGYGGGFGESKNYDIKNYLRESLKRRLYHR